jgi:phosphate starvation-inducible PhoH-like protein
MNTNKTKTSSRRTRKKLTPEEEYEAFEAINKAHSGNVLDKMKIDIKYKTQNQKKLVTEIKNKEIVICSGLPGTGKTFLSCAVALELLKSDPRYRKIVIVKSVTTLKDEEIGFLKGTMKEKMEPFMYSFMHNFEKIVGRHNVELLRANNMIEEMPIAYMRGINIDNSITIIDEAQNISIDNIRTIMTRLGENSKMIFLGDENQIDMKKKGESSLNFIIQKFSNFDEVGTVTLGEDDVVRNPLIKKIEKIFNESKM